MEEFDREAFGLQMQAGWMLGCKILEDIRNKGRERQANCKCTPNMANVCRAAFVDGFKKGWREHAYLSKRRVKKQNECIESGQDGQ